MLLKNVLETISRKQNSEPQNCCSFLEQNGSILYTICKTPLSIWPVSLFSHIFIYNPRFRNILWRLLVQSRLKTLFSLNFSFVADCEQHLKCPCSNAHKKVPAHSHAAFPCCPCTIQPLSPNSTNKPYFIKELFSSNAKKLLVNMFSSVLNWDAKNFSLITLKWSKSLFLTANCGDRCPHFIAVQFEQDVSCTSRCLSIPNSKLDLSTLCILTMASGNHNLIQQVLGLVCTSMMNAGGFKGTQQNIHL